MRQTTDYLIVSNSVKAFIFKKLNIGKMAGACGVKEMGKYWNNYQTAYPLA